MSWLSKALKGIEEAVSSVIPHQTAAERRAKADAVQTYYQQKEPALAEQQRIGAEKDMERQRIQEKTIRAMRRRYRAPGLLQGSPSSDTSEKLG